MLDISKRVLRQVGRTNGKYELIGEGDRVLLGLSGGKDSLILAHALKSMQRKAPFNFEFKAVTVDYGMGENFDTLIEHCRVHEIQHEVYKTNIYELAEEKIRPNSSSCSFFSRMRRGALYSAAKEMGYSKVALGHHFDDTAESFFMNLIYNGAMRSLAPKYTAGNGLVVIRPLLQVRERQLIEAALKHNLPTIGDETCPSQHFEEKMPHARMEMKLLLNELEGRYPTLFSSMNSAFANKHFDAFL